MTATRGLPGAASTASGVSAGVYVRRYGGVRRLAMPACSASTQRGLACCFSSSKDVASHVSRSAVHAVRSSSAPPTDKAATSAAVVCPMTDTGTSAAAKAASTSSRRECGTSATQPTSSANSTSRGVAAPAGAGSASSRPQLPAKAISSAAVTRPPSLRS